MNLNEQLQQAYEDGRRQALDEQMYKPTGMFRIPPGSYGGPYGWSPSYSIYGQMKWTGQGMWSQFTQAVQFGQDGNARRILARMLARGVISQAAYNAILPTIGIGMGALIAALASLGLLAGLIAAGIIAPGFAGIDETNPNIPTNIKKARGGSHPGAGTPGGFQNPMIPAP